MVEILLTVGDAENAKFPQRAFRFKIVLWQIYW